MREYMASQAADLEVIHAEKVAAEHVIGTTYSVWDVHTTEDRPPHEGTWERHLKGILSRNLGSVRIQYAEILLKPVF